MASKYIIDLRRNDLNITGLQGLLIVLAGSLLISIGIWNCSLPLGDEAGYILSAMKLLSNGKSTPNLYLLNYEFLLKYISSDPIVVHTICRFYTSIFSCIFMYLFLSRFNRFTNNYGILITSALWTCCALNIPVVQFGNINLFALNIVFPALILIMHKITINRALFLLFSVLWSAQTRIAYFAPFVLLLILFIYLYIRYLQKVKWKIYISRKIINTVMLFLLIILSFAFIKSYKGKSFAELDRYLLLGLEQCYTSLYSKLHPSEKISTMVEYSNVTDKVFNNPTGFIDATMKNPTEVIKYLSVNGAINSVILIPALLRHRSFFVPVSLGKKGEIIEISILLLFIVWGASIGLKELKKTGVLNRIKFIEFIKNSKFLILLALGSTSVISIFLHIPDGRYWITLSLLIYLFIAWSISHLYSKIKSSKTKLILYLVIFILFLHPLFIGAESNRKIFNKMRLAHSDSSSAPIIAGLYPGAFGTYAFGLNREIITVNNISIENIKKNKYDFVIISSYFRNSSFWNKNSDFLQSFEKIPAQFGQKKLGASSDKYKLGVYTKQ